MSKKVNIKRMAESFGVNAILADQLRPEIIYRVHNVTNLTGSAFILRFDRNGLEFAPGQHITLGLPGDNQLREYSVYSPANVDYLEVLVKEVESGSVSRKLKNLQPGDIIKVDGPFGFFVPDKTKLFSAKHLFIATGTGIAPFHSIALSYKDFDFTILHGIRYANEQYGKADYPPERYISCVSREEGGNFHGRVTDYLLKNSAGSDTLVYLCGNYEMIHAVYDVLVTNGLSPDNIRTEVYF